MSFSEISSYLSLIAKFRKLSKLYFNRFKDSYQGWAGTDFKKVETFGPTLILMQVKMVIAIIHKIH